MTLEEAIEELGTLYVPRDGEQDRLADAQEMAIRSLEAWEKVKAEIEQKYALYKFNYQGFSMSIVADCLAIIDKHLQEVKTDADSN